MVYLGVPVKIRALREEASNLNGFPSLLRLIASEIQLYGSCSHETRSKFDFGTFSPACFDLGT